MIQSMRNRGAVALIVALISYPIVRLLAADSSGSNDNRTTTPIKHVIVIIGENRSFDHVYATYRPKTGQGLL